MFVFLVSVYNMYFEDGIIDLELTGYKVPDGKMWLKSLMKYHGHLILKRKKPLLILCNTWNTNWIWGVKWGRGRIQILEIPRCCCFISSGEIFATFFWDGTLRGIQQSKEYRLLLLSLVASHLLHRMVIRLIPCSINQSLTRYKLLLWLLLLLLWFSSCRGSILLLDFIHGCC